MAQCITNTFVQGKPLIPLPTKNNQQGKKVGNFVVVSKKKDIHPNFYEDAKVYCNNELVMTTGGTQKEYVVDVWSGNHQFYLGNRSANMVRLLFLRDAKGLKVVVVVERRRSEYVILQL
ncbi:unnamed protein product [Trifolium pratense]|uniref:Uncharacterized protein n=1 Tax=Trifolium pratense TaxID=57577 RepID=A0ACB0M1E3_TRIPR|nr:unnamed protein product [Trifolium pratense]